MFSNEEREETEAILFLHSTINFSNYTPFLLLWSFIQFEKIKGDILLERFVPNQMQIAPRSQRILWKVTLSWDGISLSLKIWWNVVNNRQIFTKRKMPDSQFFYNQTIFQSSFYFTSKIERWDCFGEFLPTMNCGIWFHLSTEYWHIGIPFL